LLDDLKFLLKQVYCGKWTHYLNGYADYEDNLDDFLHNGLFVITRNQDRRNYEKTTAEEFVDALRNFRVANGKRPACVNRILQELDNRAGKNIIETAFENFEYNLKRQLYDTMEEQEKQDREFWINEVLKPELKGKYNRLTKEFKRECKTVYKI